MDRAETMEKYIQRAEHPYTKSHLRQTAIRLVKETPGIYGLPQITINADFPVDVKKGGLYEEESESEYYFYIEHEEISEGENGIIGFHIRWPGCSVMEIICEESLLPVHVEEGVYR